LRNYSATAWKNQIDKNCCVDIALKNKHAGSSGRYRGNVFITLVYFLQPNCRRFVALQSRNNSATAWQQLGAEVAQHLHNDVTE